MSFKEFVAESSKTDFDRAIDAAAPLLNDRIRVRFEDAVRLLEKGLADKSIPNARFEDLKSIINRGVEDAVKSFKAADGTQYFNLDTLIMSVSNIPTALKETQRKKITDFADFLSKFMILASGVKELKQYAVKRQPKVQGSVLDSGFSPTFSADSAKLIYGKLKEVTSQARDKQIENYYQRYKKTLQDFVSDYNKADLPQKRKLHDNLNRNAFVRMAFDSSYEWDFRNPIGRDGYHSVYSFSAKANNDSLLKNWATKQVDEMLESYMVKNTKKLAAIVEKKGSAPDMKIVSITPDQSGFASTIRFRFADNAEFTVVNKVVWVWNNFGTQFVRFPTTFHDVKNSDGSKMSMPSEEKMSTKFF